MRRDWRERLRECDNPYLGPAVGFIIAVFLWITYIAVMLIWILGSVP